MGGLLWVCPDTADLIHKAVPKALQGDILQGFFHGLPHCLPGFTLQGLTGYTQGLQPEHHPPPADRQPIRPGHVHHGQTPTLHKCFTCICDNLSAVWDQYECKIGEDPIHIGVEGIFSRIRTHQFNVLPMIVPDPLARLGQHVCAEIDASRQAETSKP